MMPCSLETVRHDILALGPDLHIDTTTPDLFFFRGAEQQMPLATIITRDTEYDSFSQLDADKDFRLNIGLTKEEFLALFPDYKARKTLEAAEFDYSARDTFLPHPLYGRMRWISIVNPDTCYTKCRYFLRESYNRAHRQD